MAVSASVGPLRAMLAAHFGASRNRLHRELGRLGIIRLLVAAALIFLCLVVPLLLVFFGLGIWVGSVMPAGGAEVVLTATITSMTLFGGAMSGVVGGAKQLTWESYRTMPVKLSRIFAAELVASSLDALPVGATLCLAALLGGMGMMKPHMLPFAPLVLIESVLFLLVVQLLVASLAERAVRRVRGALTVMSVALLVGITLSFVAPPYVRAIFDFRLDADHIDAFLKSDPPIQRLTAWLPGGLAVASLSAAIKGQPLRALGFHVVPIVLLVILAISSAQLLAREAAARNEDDAGSLVPWTFKTPFGGVWRLTIASILTSRMGRAGLVIPLVVMALVKSPFTPVMGQQYWAIPGAFLYVSLVGSQFQLNQFGLDGHGVKTLFLLPIDERTLLSGKAWGIAIYQAMQAVFLWVLLVVMHRPGLAELVAGLLLFATLVITSNTVGRRTSVLLPRMLPRRSVRGNATPLLLVLVGFVLSTGSALVLGTAWTLTVKHAPVLLVPVMALFTGLAIGVHRAMAPAADRLLRERKENILASLASSE